MSAIFTYSMKAWMIWRWALTTPLGRPVVPEVNIRSDMSPGCTPAARARACASPTPAALAMKLSQSVSACAPAWPIATTFSSVAGRQSASMAG